MTGPEGRGGSPTGRPGGWATEPVSRRRLLVGGALGAMCAAGFAVAPPAWSWSPSGSMDRGGTGADPRYVWDPEADPVVAALLQSGQVPLVNQLLSTWTTNDQPLPTGLPPVLVDFLDRARRLPPWADPSRLAAGAAFTKRYGTYLGLLYGLCSGMLSTAIPNEARAVYYSQGGSDMKLRVAKTSKLGYDLMQPTAYRAGGEMIVTACKTRLVHAAVRHLLPRSPAWEGSAVEQRPISQNDILVTWHSLATTAVRHLEAWNVPLDAVEADGYLHTWQVTGYMLGLLDEYIPASWPDAYSQAGHVLDPVLGPTSEGVELARILLELIYQADDGLTQPFIDAMIRYLLGDQVSDWIRIPSDAYWDGFVREGWPYFVTARDASLALPLMPDGYSLFDQFLEQGLLFYISDGRPIDITIPTTNRVGPVAAE